MLGLGSSLSQHTSPDYPQLRATFTSDFTSDVDGWTAHSIQNSSSDLTLAANTNPNDDLGTGPDSDGWLRGTYGVTQTDLNGIMKNGWISGYTKSPGDYIIISFKVYLVNDSGKWGGSDDVTMFISTPIAPVNPEVALDTEVTVNGTTDVDLDGAYTGTAISILTQTAGDLPQAGAVFYVKDVVVQVWN